MATATDQAAHNKELAQKLAAMMWEGRYDEVEKYLTDDYVGHDPMVPEGMHDGAEMEEQFAPMMAAMSDIEYEIKDIIAEGDLVFHRGQLSATHTGEYMGMAPTNERVVVEDHIGWRFEDGKLAESWAQYDAVGMMRQLGMEMPGPA